MRKISAHAVAKGCNRPSPSTSAYCHARARFDESTPAGITPQTGAGSINQADRAANDADGSVLDSLRIDHDRAGFAVFFDRAKRQRASPEQAVRVAMEGYSGWARPLDARRWSAAGRCATSTSSSSRVTSRHSPRRRRAPRSIRGLRSGEIWLLSPDLPVLASAAPRPPSGRSNLMCGSGSVSVTNDS